MSKIFVRDRCVDFTRQPIYPNFIEFQTCSKDGMFRHNIFWLSFALLLSLMLITRADEIELLDGQKITGNILKESKEKIIIQTEQYGKLEFDKLKIKRVSYNDKQTKGGDKEADAGLQTTASQEQNKTEKLAGQSPQVATSQVPAGPTPTPQPPPSIQPGYDAVLFGVVDDVKIRRSAAGEWIKAQDDMQLKVGDEILNGDGRVKISIRGRGEVRLPPNSHLILKSVSPDGNNITLELKGGAVWNKITPGGGLVNYQVTTPDLTAGVRGTLFKIAISEQDGSRVAVFEGKVETISNLTQEKVEIPTLTEVVVTRQGQISPPRPADPRERAEWDYWDQFAQKVESLGLVSPASGAIVAPLAQTYRLEMEAREHNIIEAETKKLERLASIFEEYYKDTGTIPTEEQGFKVLSENPGVGGWKGPYYRGEIPPRDRWDSPIRYVVGKSEVSGNVYGKLISCGPDRIFSKGNPATDDLVVMIRYYAIKPNTP